MIKYFILLVCLVLSFASNAQTDSTSLGTESPKVYDIVDEEAMPIAGLEAFYAFIGVHLDYPAEAYEKGITGTAYIVFIIDEKGDVIQAAPLTGRELGYGLDEEATRVIKLTKWVPGKLQGKAVRVRKIMPIKFKMYSKEAPLIKEG